MGFEVSRKRAIGSLKNGNFRAIDREDDPKKNLLAVGLISPERVAEILTSCRKGKDFFDAHSLEVDEDIDLFTYKTKKWYIKF
jgi:hypothetical protein